MLQEKNPDFVWIGATDKAEESDWKWTYSNPWNFTKWGSEQPDNLKGQEGDGENCAILPSNDTKYKDWNDFPCHWRELHFVCTRSICTGEMLNCVAFTHPFFS